MKTKSEVNLNLIYWWHATHTGHYSVNDLLAWDRDYEQHLPQHRFNTHLASMLIAAGSMITIWMLCAFITDKPGFNFAQLLVLLIATIAACAGVSLVSSSRRTFDELLHADLSHNARRLTPDQSCVASMRHSLDTLIDALGEDVFSPEFTARSASVVTTLPGLSRDTIWASIVQKSYGIPDSDVRAMHLKASAVSRIAYLLLQRLRKEALSLALAENERGAQSTQANKARLALDLHIAAGVSFGLLPHGAKRGMFFSAHGPGDAW